jgi:hypothetical protein
MVYNVRFIEDETRLLHELDSDLFDPHTEALLSDKPTMGESSSRGAPEESAEVRFLRDDPEQIEISVRSDRPGFLVLSDSDYPGWEATVNGKAQPIYRANYLFRAVAVDSGENSVIFRYRPASFIWGKRITLATLSVSIIMLGGIRYRSRQGDRDVLLAQG